MDISFVIYSSLAQEEFKNSKFYRKAAAAGALIKVNSYNTDLLLSKLTDTSIKAIVDAHIEDTAPKDYDEELMPLDGGLLIRYDHKIIEHQCCSELNDYQEWQKIVTEKSQTWKQIWIGHPWIFYRYKENHIELSEYYDDAPNDEDIQTKMVFQQDDFIQQLQRELSEIETFKARLYRIIDTGNYSHKEVLKEKLIY